MNWSRSLLHNDVVRDDDDDDDDDDCDDKDNDDDDDDDGNDDALTLEAIGTIHDIACSRYLPANFTKNL